MYFTALLNALVIAALSPLCVGIIRRLKALMQNRRGASVFQPYRNLAKLFGKGEVISRDASWIFRAAPYVVFAVSLALASGLPLIPGLAGFAPTGDLLVFVYLIALGTFFLALAALDTGNPFGGLGATREMTFSSVVEGGMVFSLLTLAAIARSTDFSAMQSAVSHLPFIHYAPAAIAFVAFFIALLMETARYPFDNPATHLELTMVHEAAIIEYSGKRLALMEWAAANKMLVFLVVGANLFFPWGTDSLALGLPALAAKILIMLAGIAVLESTTAKYRYFRLPDLLFTSFILGVIAVLLVIA